MKTPPASVVVSVCATCGKPITEGGTLSVELRATLLIVRAGRAVLETNGRVFELPLTPKQAAGIQNDGSEFVVCITPAKEPVR
jgi:hypothetical protein